MRTCGLCRCRVSRRWWRGREWCLGRHNSEAFEEGQERVGWPVAAGGGAWWRGPCECFFLEGEGGVEVDACCLGLLVAQPQGDDGHFDAGVEQSHGGGVAVM